MKNGLCSAALLLILCSFLVACFKPVFTKVGMSYESFKEMCLVTDEELYFSGKSKSMSNTQGTFFTIELENTEARRAKDLAMKGCVGKFTFLNDKLDTIH